MVYGNRQGPEKIPPSEYGTVPRNHDTHGTANLFVFVNNMISKHLCGSDIKHFPLTALIYVHPSFWDPGPAFQLIVSGSQINVGTW
jgi:hypothetical protein